jgi:hypothetical protein
MGRFSSLITLIGQFAGGVDPVSDRKVAPGINDLSLAVDDPEAVLGGLIANPEITALLHPVRDLAAVLSVPNPGRSWMVCGKIEAYVTGKSIVPDRFARRLRNEIDRCLQKARLKSPTNCARDEAAAEHLGKLIK